MGLNKQTLENVLARIFNISVLPQATQENIKKEDVADTIATAIVNYVKDATIVITVPGSSIVSGAPDPSGIGTELHPQTALVVAGQHILKRALIRSMNAAENLETPLGWPLFKAEYLVYLATLVLWEGGGYTGQVVITPTRQPPLSHPPQTAQEAAKELANAIHISTTSARATAAPPLFVKPGFIGGTFAPSTTIG